MLLLIKAWHYLISSSCLLFNTFETCNFIFKKKVFFIYIYIYPLLTHYLFFHVLCNPLPRQAKGVMEKEILPQIELGRKTSAGGAHPLQNSSQRKQKTKQTKKTPQVVYMESLDKLAGHKKYHLLIRVGGCRVLLLQSICSLHKLELQVQAVKRFRLWHYSGMTAEVSTDLYSSPCTGLITIYLWSFQLNTGHSETQQNYFLLRPTITKVKETREQKCSVVSYKYK